MIEQLWDKCTEKFNSFEFSDRIASHLMVSFIKDIRIFSQALTQVLTLKRKLFPHGLKEAQWPFSLLDRKWTMLRKWYLKKLYSYQYQS